MKELSFRYLHCTLQSKTELLNRVIMVKACTIWIEAKLPKDLWPEIVQTTGYLTNRSPSKNLNWMTLYKKLHTAQPDLTYLKVFRCCVYLYIPKECHL